MHGILEQKFYTVDIGRKVRSTVRFSRRQTLVIIKAGLNPYII